MVISVIPMRQSTTRDPVEPYFEWLGPGVTGRIEQLMIKNASDVAIIGRVFDHQLFWSCLPHPLQETGIVVIEVTNIIDLALHHGLALDAHAEGEAAELGWIVAAVF